MADTLCILGRQPAIGLAELESLYGSSAITSHSADTALVAQSIDAVPLNRLGGSIKTAQVITRLPATKWSDIEAYLLAHSELFPLDPESKVQFGISVYGKNVPVNQIAAGALKIKKAWRARGQSVRVIPNQTAALSSAQVFHNHLTGSRGLELIIAIGSDTVLAQTIAVQDIDSYTQRDRSRPKRDARVGMLPPKLAQIMVNLAAPRPGDIVLDPFCGTGVVLQEAALMGYQIYGTDLEPRMVDYTKTNLEWLAKNYGEPPHWTLDTGDATQYHWQPFNVVVSELYLGQAFSAPPEFSVLNRTRQTVNLIVERFLLNIHDQLAKDDSRLALAVPAWLTSGGNEILHLPLLDHLEELGYNRMSFSHVSNRELIYYRPGQIVGRELIVIKRK